MAKQEKGLVPVGDYAIVASKESVQQVRDVIEDNLGGESITINDLDRVRLPAGGGTTWEIPTLDGVEEAKEISGIVVHTFTHRVFWEQSLDEGGGAAPPDCFSSDCITGSGMFGPGSAQNPSGKCRECPMSQFGSATKGKGQGCQQRRAIFLLQPDALLPVVVDAPPTSLKAARKYLLDLARVRPPKSVHNVITVLSLEKDKNDGGIAFSKIIFKYGGDVPEEHQESIKAYAQALEPILKQATEDLAKNAEPAMGPEADMDVAA